MGTTGRRKGIKERWWRSWDLRPPALARLLHLHGAREISRTCVAGPGSRQVQQQQHARQHMESGGALLVVGSEVNRRARHRGDLSPSCSRVATWAVRALMGSEPPMARCSVSSFCSTPISKEVCVCNHLICTTNVWH
jgi:hypothetical protein